MFIWRYLDGSENEVGESQPFEDQESAESWLSQEWGGLHERGIEEVVLFDAQNNESVYRMGLGPGSD
jgi:hypothetical protein